MFYHTASGAAYARTIMDERRPYYLFSLTCFNDLWASPDKTNSLSASISIGTKITVDHVDEATPKIKTYNGPIHSYNRHRHVRAQTFTIGRFHKEKVNCRLHPSMS